jgi:hypothetical protein
MQSDNGSKLWIDGKEILKNKWNHYRETNVEIELAAGEHKFKALHWEDNGGAHM